MKLQTLADFERELGRTKDKQFLVSPDHIRKMAFEFRDEFLNSDRYEIMEKYKEIFHDFEPSCEIGVVVNFINHFFKEYKESGEISKVNSHDM